MSFQPIDCLRPEQLALLPLGKAAELDLLLKSASPNCDVASALRRPESRLWCVKGPLGQALAVALGEVLGNDSELLAIATRSTWRRQGVARRLLAYVLGELRLAGALQVFLEVRRSNEEAIRLYTATGFHGVAERRDYYANPSEDAIVMGRSLLDVKSERTGGRKNWLEAPLLRIDDHGQNYFVLTFGVAHGALDARPGQFVMIRGADWGEAPLLPRPMSLLSSGDEPTILIKVVGEGTRRLARARRGDRFTLLGPLGTSWRAPARGRRSVLVAGGVGVAPLLYLARDLKSENLPFISLYGGRTARDLPLLESLKQLGPVLVTTEDGSLGEKGRVTELLATVLEANDTIYTCGPDRMMAKVAESCRQRELSCQASLETPMGCGYGVCLGCAVKNTDARYFYACVEGPCVDAAAVDWSRDEAFSLAAG